MAGFSPAPLPSESSLFDPVANTGAGATAFLPSIGLVLTGKGIRGATGTYALTGNAAALREGHVLASGAGAFSESGQAATLTKSGISQGGDAAPLVSLSTLFILDAHHKILFANAGAYSVAGAATLIKGRVLSASAGSYLWKVAPSLSDYQLTANAGSFAVTPVAGTVRKGNPGITASPGSYVLTANQALLVHQSPGHSILAAFPGAYQLTGNAATFAPRNYVLTGNTGLFVMTGDAATFIAVHWGRINAVTGTWTPVTSASTSWQNA